MRYSWVGIYFIRRGIYKWVCQEKWIWVTCIMYIGPCFKVACLDTALQDAGKISVTWRRLSIFLMILLAFIVSQFSLSFTISIFILCVSLFVTYYSLSLFLLLMFHFLWPKLTVSSWFVLPLLIHCSFFQFCIFSVFLLLQAVRSHISLSRFHFHFLFFHFHFLLLFF